MILRFLDNFEKYVCQLCLALFVCILFAQIVSREVFGYSLTWSEELSVILFVWFAYFGASFAVRQAAHNRVVFQYKILPKDKVWIFELLSDGVWLAFNLILLYYFYDYVANAKVFNFWKAQTLGIKMQYVFAILPIAFALMSIRIIQVNYIKFILKQRIVDPESSAVEKLMHKGASKEETT